MANSLLFARGSTSHPALVVYASEGGVDFESLKEEAHAVFSLRGSKPLDPSLASFVKGLGDNDRPLAVRVPDAVAHGRPLCVTSLIIHREDLPLPYLGASLLPLVVDERGFATVLPHPFWGSDLRGAWVDLAAEG